ncbi:hypothetical protein WJX79_001228 [Trebouxia sp. C0005]
MELQAHIMKSQGSANATTAAAQASYTVNIEGGAANGRCRTYLAEKRLPNTNDSKILMHAAHILSSAPIGLVQERRELPSTQPSTRSSTLEKTVDTEQSLIMGSGGSVREPTLPDSNRSGRLLALASAPGIMGEVLLHLGTRSGPQRQTLSALCSSAAPCLVQADL